MVLIALTDPVPGRSCGSCTLCCKVMGIAELKKPVGKWCPHCSPAKGCAIYGDRPSECRAFNCGWLVDARFHEGWKPEKSKMVVTTGLDGNSFEIRCDPGFPAVWRSEPFHSEIREMATAAERHDGSVYVMVGKKTTLVTRDLEFELGEISVGQRIVRERSGRRVVGVRVVNVADLDKAK